MSPSVAILLPCHNEETAIASVVQAFRKAVPEADIYVYDNNSTDRTAEVARAAGAIVRFEPLVGKGNVVRRMFADVEADVYVVADGDGTYDVSKVASMIDLLVTHNLDMVVGVREAHGVGAYRWGHQFGNWFLTSAIAWIFGRRFSDVLSGYRVFSRRFVKSFPAEARGFATETELTVHSLQMRLPVAEYPVSYRARPSGSTSKLNSFRDGLRILGTIGILLKEERPLLFFSALSLLLAVASLVLVRPVLVTYLATGLVPRLPTAVLATGIMILAFISLTCGILLDSVSRGRREAKRLHYLALPPPHPKSRASSAQDQMSQRGMAISDAGGARPFLNHLVRLNRLSSMWFIGGIVAIFVLLYLYQYFTYYALPGKNPKYPEGWFGWWDQGQYLRSARALSRGDLSPANHWYPFGYPLIAVPFIGLLANHPWLVVNLLLGAASSALLFKIYSAFLSKIEAAAMLLATFVFPYTILEELVIPWNTIPTQTCFYALSLLLLRGATDFPAGLATGALSGATFLFRPGDALFVAPLLLAFLVQPSPSAKKARFLLGALVSGPLFPAVLLSLNHLVFGRLTTPYAEAIAAVGFTSENLGVRLYSIFYGATSLYLVDTPMLFKKFPWLPLAVPGLAAALVVLAHRRLWLAANAVSVAVCLIFYGAFNEFDPVNLFKYHTFHYLVWSVPLLTLFAYLGLRHLPATLRRPGALTAALVPAVLLLTAHIDVSPPRQARIELVPDDLTKLTGCAASARTGSTRPPNCDIAVPTAIRRCANVLDFPGLLAREHRSLFLRDGPRQMEEPEFFRRVTSAEGTRLILHTRTCDSSLALGVRGVDDLVPPLAFRAYWARLKLMP